VFSPRLASSGTQAGGGVCPLKGGGRVFCTGCPGGGGGRGGLVLPRILITCPGSQGTSCPCSLFMIRVEVPGSSFLLCLGPGPPSLLHLTRANAEKPYAGDTSTTRDLCSPVTRSKKRKVVGLWGTFRMNRKLLGKFPLFLQIVLKML
jgi:hypothetical protein